MAQTAPGTAAPPNPTAPATTDAPEGPEAAHPARHRTALVVLVAGLVAAGAIAAGLWLYYRNIATTDDAYVKAHVSFIAPRVPSNVIDVLVDDNYQVEPNQLLVRLDPEPYRIAVAERQAALEVADAAVTQAQAQVRSAEAQARAAWYSLIAQRERVRTLIAQLHSQVAMLDLHKADREYQQIEFDRISKLIKQGDASPYEWDATRTRLKDAKMQVAAAEQALNQTRATLGLPPDLEKPLDVPTDLEQAFSGVQTALSQWAHAMTQIGLDVRLYGMTPEDARKMLDRLAPGGDVNQALARVVERAPDVKLAEARALQARRDLERAQLELSYCDIRSPIRGFVFKRSVNPGNHVVPGQNLMGVRSLDDVWIDANFKETQLERIRIGQAVDLYVDAYPGRVFKARVQGFSVGTGSALALLPPENATGNFVKIVQRLPVRLELVEPAPRDAPLFVGLSCVPQVRLDSTPSGPNAGLRLQDPRAIPSSRPADSAHRP